jgi:dienelactone hydrolase
MLQALFYTWERWLAERTTDRVVRPFEWGLDWVTPNGWGPGQPPAAILAEWVAEIMRDTDSFYTPEPTSAYQLATEEGGNQFLTFPSALTTPHPENNVVSCQWVPTKQRRRKAAVLVLPQWNADAGGHIGLCRLLAMNGMSALRLSMPYHDRRMPAELHRADYIVSSNIARTLQVCRQAVVDARRAIWWLAHEGYERIGILGTSLGSCLSLLTTAHEPLVRAQALNHISPYFADVVWRGLSTRHVREGLNGHIDLDLLRTLWQPISPRFFLNRLQHRTSLKTLLVYARYDLSFPVDLSEELVGQFRDQAVPHELAVLPCGHYSTGKTPFKFLDGWILTRFLKNALA